MGLNKVVEFSAAKLLKEKGFDKLSEWAYQSGKLVHDSRNKEHKNWNKEKHVDCTAPTISEVVMWLYEKHEIWIEPRMGKDHTGIWFDWDIFSTILPRKDDELGEEDVEYEDDPNEKWLNYDTTYSSMIDESFTTFDKKSYSSPAEAYEAAILYTLNNLI